MRVTPLLVLALAGCSSSSPDGASPSAPPASTTTQAETCSDGPRYPDGTQFGTYGGSHDELPACIAHCGDVPKGSRGDASTGALPSGSCSDGAATCEVLAEQVPACPPEMSGAGPVSEFVCHCASGAWTCEVRDQGADLPRCLTGGR